MSITQRSDPFSPEISRHHSGMRRICRLRSTTVQSMSVIPVVYKHLKRAQAWPRIRNPASLIGAAVESSLLAAAMKEAMTEDRHRNNADDRLALFRHWRAGWHRTNATPPFRV
jgi:hypothetical protein